MRTCSLKVFPQELEGVYDSSLICDIKQKLDFAEKKIYYNVEDNRVENIYYHDTHTNNFVDVNQQLQGYIDESKYDIIIHIHNINDIRVIKNSYNSQMLFYKFNPSNKDNTLVGWNFTYPNKVQYGMPLITIYNDVRNIYLQGAYIPFTIHDVIPYDDAFYFSNKFTFKGGHGLPAIFFTYFYNNYLLGYSVEIDEEFLRIVTEGYEKLIKPELEEIYIYFVNVPENSRILIITSKDYKGMVFLRHNWHFSNLKAYDTLILQHPTDTEKFIFNDKFNLAKTIFDGNYNLLNAYLGLFNYIQKLKFTKSFITTSTKLFSNMDVYFWEVTNDFCMFDEINNDLFYIFVRDAMVNTFIPYVNVPIMLSNVLFTDVRKDRLITYFDNEDYYEYIMYSVCNNRINKEKAIQNFETLADTITTADFPIELFKNPMNLDTLTLVGGYDFASNRITNNSLTKYVISYTYSQYDDVVSDHIVANNINCFNTSFIYHILDDNNKDIKLNLYNTLVNLKYPFYISITFNGKNYYISNNAITNISMLTNIFNKRYYVNVLDYLYDILKLDNKNAYYDLYRHMLDEDNWSDDNIYHYNCFERCRY